MAMHLLSRTLATTIRTKTRLPLPAPSHNEKGSTGACSHTTKKDPENVHQRQREPRGGPRDGFRQLPVQRALNRWL